MLFRSFLALAFYNLGISPWSAFPLKSFLYSCWLLFDIGMVWLSTQILFRRLGAVWFARLIFGTLLFLSGIILMDYAAYPFGYRGGLIGFNQDIILNLMVSRPHAFASEPSYAAAYLALGLFTIGPFLLRNSKRKPLAALGLSMIAFAAIATTSRSGWAGLAFGSMILLALTIFAGKKIPWKILLRVALAIPVLIGIFLATTPKAQLENLNQSFVRGLFQGNDSSGNSRLKALSLAVEMAKETKGLGTGIGASYRYFKDHGGFDYDYQEKFGARQYGNEVIMSTWGQILAEQGAIGLLLFTLAAFFLLRSLWRKWKVEDSPLAFGSLTAALVFFGFMAMWLGNICRGDVWVWYSIWSAIAARGTKGLDNPGVTAI